MTTTGLQRWYPGLSEAFLSEVIGIGERQGIDPLHLLAVMDFETDGTFDPTIRNPYSDFVGLIQFGPEASAAIGTTTGQLSKMSRLMQLNYVEKYFALRRRQYGQLGSIEDVYMAVLYPAAIGKPADYVLFQVPSTAYVQNSGLDKDGDGRVTKQEAAAPVRRRLRGGLARRLRESIQAGLGSTFFLAVTAGSLIGISYNRLRGSE